MTKLYRNYAVYAAAAIILMACATVQTPAQRVYQIETNYAAALEIAVAYKKLPPCSVAAICSRPQIVKELQDADSVAYPALQAAQHAVRSDVPAKVKETSLEAASAAAGAFTAITSTITVK